MNNEIIRAGQISIRFLVEPAQSNGAVSVFEFTVPAGAKVPLPHYHEQFDEVIYGLEGALTFTVDAKAHQLSRGDSCFVPRGSIHGFTNAQPADAKALAVITPGVLGPDYFKDLAALVNAGGPPDIEKVKAVMTKHGLVPVLSAK